MEALELNKKNQKARGNLIPSENGVLFISLLCHSWTGALQTRPRTTGAGDLCHLPPC